MEKKILWINDPNKLPSNIRNQLMEEGVSINSLGTIPSLLIDAVNQGHISEEEGKQYYERFKLVYFFIEQSDWGSATDIARYLVIFLYGGVYVDGDYRIDNLEKIEKLMGTSDSFFGVERNRDVRLGNAFLASKKYGKVIKEALSYRNSTAFITKEDPKHTIYPGNWSTQETPDYINSDDSSIGVICRTGPIALTIAFEKHKSEEETKMLEYCSDTSIAIQSG